MWAIISRKATMQQARCLHLGERAHRLAMLRNMDSPSTRMPGDFLISPNGRILVTHYGRDAGDFLVFRDLEAAAFGAPLDANVALRYS